MVGRYWKKRTRLRLFKNHSEPFGSGTDAKHANTIHKAMRSRGNHGDFGFVLKWDDQVERSQCAAGNDQRVGFLRFGVGVGAQFEQNLLSCAAFGNSFIAESFGEGHIEAVFLKKDLQS